MAEERLTDDPVEKKQPDLFEVEGEEYDDDLVGLTPGKLEEELERRRLVEARARAEREKMLSDAKAKFDAQDYEGAAAAYQRLAEQGDAEAETWAWRARTHDYADLECFTRRRQARQFARAGAEARQEVLSHLQEKIDAEISACEQEAAPLREKVYAGMEARRDAFKVNRNYYLLRFGICFAVFAALLIACAVSASFIVRTRGMTVPILTAVFGGLALVVLPVVLFFSLWGVLGAQILVLFFSRRLYVAQRLVGDNEKLSSTDDGARLAALEERISLFKTVLEGETEDLSAYREDEDADALEDGEASDEAETGAETDELSEEETAEE